MTLSACRRGVPLGLSAHHHWLQDPHWVGCRVPRVPALSAADRARSACCAGCLRCFPGPLVGASLRRAPRSQLRGRAHARRAGVGPREPPRPNGAGHPAPGDGPPPRAAPGRSRRHRGCAGAPGAPRRARGSRGGAAGEPRTRVAAPPAGHRGHRRGRLPTRRDPAGGATQHPWALRVRARGAPPGRLGHAAGAAAGAARCHRGPCGDRAGAGRDTLAPGDPGLPAGARWRVAACRRSRDAGSAGRHRRLACARSRPRDAGGRQRSPRGARGARRPRGAGCRTGRRRRGAAPAVE
jgi:hypothetical protein